jgi:hypothetical protein
VILLRYDIGIHTHEELQIEIVNRGKRMKTWLEAEIASPTTLMSCVSQESRLEFQEEARSLIKAIDKGEHWEE